MATKLTNASAASGFMPFDLSELHDFWGNLRDGNFWDALKKGISILDSILNYNGAVAGYSVRSFNPEIGESCDQCCEYLEQWVQNANANPDEVMAAGGRLRADKPGVDIGSIIAIVNLLVGVIAEWRKRRTQPTEQAQPTVMDRAPDGRPLEPARPTQPATSNPNDAQNGGTADNTATRPPAFNENPSGRGSTPTRASGATGPVQPKGAAASSHPGTDEGVELFPADSPDDKPAGPAEGDTASPDKRDDKTDVSTGGKTNPPQTHPSVKGGQHKGPGKK